ncbi:MAG: hypothetical protein KA371_05060 [Acidobacteria bacterium]|nr:hypothetical protein [Acidobacteriota bacterium]
MTSVPLRCTEYTRIAGWMSALVTTATFSFLHDAYDRLPLLVPIRFDDGNPSQFAFKSVELVYLPFGLQVALSLVFMAIVAVLIRRSTRQDDRGLAAVSTQHAAEGIALLAMIWIAFQGVNAWRLAMLYRRTFDAHQEIFVVALITAITASVVIVARVVLKVQDGEAGSGEASQLSAPVLDHRRRPLAVAALAIALGVGIAAPFYILASVWGGLRPIY